MLADEVSVSVGEKPMLASRLTRYSCRWAKSPLWQTPEVSLWCPCRCANGASSWMGRPAVKRSRESMEEPWQSLSMLDGWSMPLGEV